MESPANAGTLAALKSLTTQAPAPVPAKSPLTLTEVTFPVEEKVTVA